MKSKKLNKALPFIRWAGGKTRLMNRLEEYFPTEFNNYHEPFLGGASVFFHLQPENKSYLSDLNPDLINTYIQIRDNVNDLLSELETYKNSEKFYYEMREKHFRDPIKQAAKFIYLNKTSFNGIYRVNNQGKYNVPYGFKKNPVIADEENLLLVSKQLANVNLQCQDFGKSLSKVKAGDLVFLDPPYTVAHENNGFIQYNQKIFSLKDQIRLSQWVDKLKSVGAYFIMTNAKHNRIKEIYENNTPIIVSRPSTVGGTGAERKKVPEYIFTNCIIK